MLFNQSDNTNVQPSNALFKATREIADAFASEELKFEANRLDEMSMVETGFSGENTTGKILFVSTDDNNDVEVRSPKVVAQIPEDKKTAVLECLNNLNSKYRYIKYVLDGKSIHAEYDVAVSAENIGEIAVEIFVRFAKIIDDSYPELMKAIWG